MKKPNWILIGILFGVSLFIGFAIFSAAIGAIFPKLHNISKPLLCSGDFKIETTRYSYKPGQVGWQHNVYCDGKDITLLAVFTTGMLFSLGIFMAACIRFWKALFNPADFGSLAKDLKQADKPARGKKKKSPLERMAELKEMRDQNLISDVEYERKKAEIMNEL